MNESLITVRYAKALFSLAKEKGILDSLKNDIEKIALICNQSTEFILLLESPIIKTSKKIDLINQIFKGNIQELTHDFLVLIITNKRESHIPGICRYFLVLSRKDIGIKTVMITTAEEFSPDFIKKISSIIEKGLNSKIELEQKTDSSIIGGIILRVEDKQLDSSVAKQLKEIKNTLINTEI